MLVLPCLSVTSVTCLPISGSAGGSLWLPCLCLSWSSGLLSEHHCQHCLALEREFYDHGHHDRDEKVPCLFLAHLFSISHLNRDTIPIFYESWACSRFLIKTKQENVGSCGSHGSCASFRRWIGAGREAGTQRVREARFVRFHVAKLATFVFRMFCPLCGHLLSHLLRSRSTRPQTPRAPPRV